MRRCASIRSSSKAASRPSTTAAAASFSRWRAWETGVSALSSISKPSRSARRRRRRGRMSTSAPPPHSACLSARGCSRCSGARRAHLRPPCSSASLGATSPYHPLQGGCSAAPPADASMVYNGGAQSASIHQIFSGRLDLPARCLWLPRREGIRPRGGHVKDEERYRSRRPSAPSRRTGTCALLPPASQTEPGTYLSRDSQRRATVLRLRADKIVDALRPNVVNDVYSSAEYRLFTFKRALMEIFALEREGAMV